MTEPVLSNRIERRKIEFRDKITEAALKLFAEQGVNDTSVSSIIKEADIAHKTFFNHFPTKDHLIQHIVSSYSDHAYSVFRDAFKRYNEPEKRIEYCFITIAKTVEASHPNYKQLMNFYFISGAGSNDVRLKQKAEFSAVVNQIMSDAKLQGKLRADFTQETLTDMVMAICVSTLLNWSMEENYPLLANMKKAIKFINASVFVNV